MAQANSVSTIQSLTVQEAAAEIVRLINMSPRSPWPSDIEAIVAKVAGPASPLDASDAALINKVRTAIVREVTAGQRYGEDETNDPRFGDECRASWDDLHAIQKTIPFPPRTAVQMLCHTEIAYHGADKGEDGKVAADDGDCFEGTAARLLIACMAYFGAVRL